MRSLRSDRTVRTATLETPTGGGGAPPSATAHSPAGPADGAPTNVGRGLQRPALPDGRRAARRAPGGCATRSAAATSLRCGSNGAAPSPPRRSGGGRAASRRASLRGAARRVGAAPAAPGPWTRPTCRSPGAGALSTAPSTGRAPSWTPGAARTATRTPRGASCGAWWDVAERTPQRITTDAHPPDRRAIRWILGRKVRHRCRQDWNTRTEHSPRAVQQRSDPMLGFGRFASAARFCSAFDARRHSFRARQRRGQSVPLAEQRRLFVPRWRSLMAERQAA